MSFAQTVSGRRWATLVLLGAWAAGSGAAQLHDPRGLAKGRLLVADRNLTDPNFVKTVILLLEYDSEGAVGIVLNRPTPVALSRLLPQIRSLADRPHTAFLGGPVEPSKIFVLVRTTAPPAESNRVFGDVHASTSGEALEQLAKTETRFRAYAGYAGWGPGQLEGEVIQGAWHILQATAADVFPPTPAGLWQQLFDRTRERIAQLR